MFDKKLKKNIKTIPRLISEIDKAKSFLHNSISVNINVYNKYTVNLLQGIDEAIAINSWADEYIKSWLIDMDNTVGTDYSSKGLNQYSRVIMSLLIKRVRSEITHNNEILKQQDYIRGQNNSPMSAVYRNRYKYGEYNTFNISKQKIDAIYNEILEMHYKDRAVELIKSYYPLSRDFVFVKSVKDIDSYGFSNESLATVDPFTFKLFSKGHVFDLVLHKDFYDIACDPYSSLTKAIKLMNGITSIKSELNLAITKAMTSGVSKIDILQSTLNLPRRMNLLSHELDNDTFKKDDLEKLPNSMVKTSRDLALA